MRLTESMKNKVQRQAEGSFYRLNAGSADCYAFSLYRNDKGKLDFDGGWDWSYRLVDTEANRLYMFADKSFHKIVNGKAV